MSILLNGTANKTAELATDVSTLMVGSIGCGKTTVAKALFGAQRSAIDRQARGCMVVFDPKNDFRTAFYRPGDLILGENVQWNYYEDLMLGFDADTPFRLILNRALEMAGMLFAQRLKPGASQEQYFPRAASEVLAAVTAIQASSALKCPELRGELDNEFFYEFWTSVTAEKILDLLQPYPELRSIRYHLTAGNEGGVSGQGNGVMSEFALIRQTMSGRWSESGRFSIRRFIREKAANCLFIPYFISSAKTDMPVRRMIVDMALQESMMNGLDEGEVIFLLEELHLLTEPPLEYLPQAINYGRTYQVRLQGILQNLDQLYLNYGPNGAEAIISGFPQKLIFRADSAFSLEYPVRLFGKKRIIEYLFNSRGERIQHIRDGNMVESWELVSLGVGEFYLKPPGNGEPFRFQMRLEGEQDAEGME